MDGRVKWQVEVCGGRGGGLSTKDSDWLLDVMLAVYLVSRQGKSARFQLDSNSLSYLATYLPIYIGRYLGTRMLGSTPFVVNWLSCSGTQSLSRAASRNSTPSSPNIARTCYLGRYLKACNKV